MTRLELLILLNPDFAKAIECGEKWALNTVGVVSSLDGKSFRRHPERAFRENGTPNNWCDSCPFEEGCVICDLD